MEMGRQILSFVSHRCLGFWRRFERSTWLAFFLIALSTMGLAGARSYFALYLLDAGVSEAVAGFVMTVSFMIAAIAIVAMGVFATRVGEKRALLAYLVVGTVGFLLVAYCSYHGASPFIAAAFFTAGVPAAFAVRASTNAQAAQVRNSTARNSVFVILFIGLNLGFILGSVASGCLADISYGLLYAILSLTYVLAAILATLFFDETLPSKSDGQTWRPGLAAIVRDRKSLWFYGLTLAAYTVFAQFGVTFSIYAVERIGVSKTQLGYLFGMNGLGIVLFQYPLTSITRRLTPDTARVLGMLIISVGFLSVALARSLWPLAASTVILTLGETLLVPALLSTATSLAPADGQARYMRLFFSVQLMGYGLAPVLGGLLLSGFSGTAVLAWDIVGLAGLLCALGYYRLGKPRRAANTS